eukprot:CAMPEP_0176382270 /NCGR_PEP_ID=MMETSP0126-20121128/32555_1 /TAXON_ID=141414 ORGANISM="Strombidinopsis acuminatum, Strain SPMC142" /NCGR_SAMPLE_ID=MMETSP0126 /ASSEMBLY_ACC=CAM_ASM_000229 /LENGTH=141 /DNA_ID=CAMNT_0017746609 /DNA_START=121 /DNA_END=546 /DNA_ORIENTATION=-
MTYYEYLGRRQAYWSYYMGGTEDERREYAQTQKGNWGYHPRYEAKYDFSLKTRKYDLQTPEEKLSDMPRMMTKEGKQRQQGMMRASDINTFTRIVKEHNRQPGVFDYNYPQQFYSLFPEIDRETYITIGNAKAQKRVHGHD